MTALPRLETTPSACPACAVVPSAERLAALSAAASGRIMLSLPGAALAASYPLMKRFTHMPQLVLGLAFSWGIPMAFAAQTNTLPTGCWLLFIGNVFGARVHSPPLKLPLKGRVTI